MSSGEKVLEFRCINEWNNAHEEPVCAYLFVEERDLLLTASYDNSIKIWKMSRKDNGKIDFHQEPMLQKKISKDFRSKDPNFLLRWDNSTFMTGTDDGTVISYSLDTPFNRKKFFILWKMVNEHNELLSKKKKDVVEPIPPLLSVDASIRVLSVSKVVHLNDRGRVLSSNARNNEFVVLCRRILKPISKNEKKNKWIETNGFISVVNYSEERILYHHIIDREHIEIATYSRHVGSKSVPNAVFVQTGRKLNFGRKEYGDFFSRETKKYHNCILMMDIISGEIKKIFNAEVTYGLDNFIDKNGKEFLFCEGNSDNCILYEVETTLVFKKFATRNTPSSFLRLGGHHYLVGEEDSIVDLFDLVDSEKDDLPPICTYSGSGDEDYDEKVYSIKPLYFEPNEDFDCLGLLTNLSKKNKGQFYQAGDEIFFIACSSSRKQYFFGIRNLDDVELLEEDQEVDLEQLQSQNDLRERIECLLFDENLYTCEGEEFSLLVFGQVIFKHSVLKILLL